MRTPILYKGDIVECPQCKLEIATITRDAYTGDLMGEDLFATKTWPLHNGDLCRCRECGEDWGKVSDIGAVHVKHGGWVPRDPENL